MATHPTLSNWLSIVALGVIWGGTFMVVSIALRGYGPLTVACARTTLGATALLLLMRVMGRPWPKMSPRLIRYLLVIGLTNTALPFALLSWGQQFVPSAFAGISMAALPLFVLPLAHFFTDEKMHLRSMVGVLTGFCGALVLIGPGVMRIGTGMEPLGQLACVAASVCYAISSILTRRCPPIDSITMAAFLLVIGSIALIPAMLWIEGVPQLSDPLSMGAILFLGFVPTALAALLRVFTIRSAGAVFMTLVNYQVPLWAMFFGSLILLEQLPLRFFVALMLILTGLAISQWGSLKRLFGAG
ncbi:DMT family transporter [Yoonia sediminilitoris]|uniref:Drug/metabolite transporter (DMT)-like permease n=1 Tax=Yoonia sediminilitoris TaxID=1286148 RepID=A0A2T6KEJ9_9RHOB|nr:DMT family transporter [Yoonia sediminilitoris]PUB13556.1 drug/metabolite transporter (DMT)-like permease [Yoonia sediminilitoris]RCW94726.1 drug/metabolite transporter (DMT)-like permease [Yoonia sediminilitoris]